MTYKMTILFLMAALACTGCTQNQNESSADSTTSATYSKAYSTPEDSISGYSEALEPDHSIDDDLETESNNPSGDFGQSSEIQRESLSTGQIDEPSVPAASAPKTPGSASSKSKSDSTLDSVEAEIINLINAQRKSLGLDSLTQDSTLTQAARIRSREMYENGALSHTRPNGKSWSTVLTDDVSITYSAAGENLAMTDYSGTGDDKACSAEYWYGIWKNSRGHYENMIKPDFGRAGVGIYCVNKDGKTVAYATTVFTS